MLAGSKNGMNSSLSYVWRRETSTRSRSGRPEAALAKPMTYDTVATLPPDGYDVYPGEGIHWSTTVDIPFVREPYVSPS